MHMIFSDINTLSYACAAIAFQEYGIGNEVTTQGDVYSYGILVLEIFTGRRPKEENFGEDLNLQKFVEAALPDHVEDIVDQNLLSPREDTGGIKIHS